MSLDNSWVNLYLERLDRTKIDLVNNFERILHTLSGRRETRTLTVSRHILSVVRLPIPPLALFRRDTVKYSTY